MHEYILIHDDDSCGIEISAVEAALLMGKSVLFVLDAKSGTVFKVLFTSYILVR